MRLATLVTLVLALLPPAALAQGEYQPPVKLNADEIAISFIAGHYVSPVTCKLTDGSQVEVNDSIELKPSPDAAGGKSLKATFFGIEIANAEYCYSSLERRVPNRRGILYLHFRTRNRPDYGVADFRRMAEKGPLTYNAHRGELQVSEVGQEGAGQAPKVLAFDGGDSRVIADGIAPGTDGAKLVGQYFASHPQKEEATRRVVAFRFIAKDGSEFMFYGIDANR